MNIEAFVNKWHGKKVEAYDPSNYAQCTDLVLEWIKEQGHGDLIPLGILHAYEIWTKTPSKVLTHYNKVANTLEAIPRAGDIIVWGKSYNGTSGHTAICTGWAGQTQFEAFSQNDPVGVGCIIKRYSYNHVLGWLRLKSLPNENMNELQTKLNKYFNQVVNADFVISFINNEKSENTKKDKAITEKDKEISKLKEVIAVLENKSTADLAKAEVDCQRRVDDVKDRLNLEIADKEKRIADLEKAILVEGNVVVEYEKPRKGFHKKLVDILDILFSYER